FRPIRVSPTTAAITDVPAAIRTPAARCGTAAGAVTRRNARRSGAPSAWTTSMIDPPADASPERQNTYTEENTITAASTRAVVGWYPEIRASSGNRATSGAAAGTITGGVMAPATSGRRAPAAAATTPTTVPSSRPTAAVSSVWAVAAR